MMLLTPLRVELSAHQNGEIGAALTRSRETP